MKNVLFFFVFILGISIFLSCNKEPNDECMDNLYGIYKGKISCGDEDESFSFKLTSNSDNKIYIEFRLDEDDDDSLVYLVGLVNSDCNAVDIQTQIIEYESDEFEIGGSFSITNEKIVGIFEVFEEDDNEVEERICSYVLTKI